MSKNNEKLELKETLDDPADVILNHIADAILTLDYKNNITYANVLRVILVVINILYFAPNSLWH